MLNVLKRATTPRTPRTTKNTEHLNILLLRVLCGTPCLRVEKAVLKKAVLKRATTPRTSVSITTPH
jgi:hypothetical protein